MRGVRGDRSKLVDSLQSNGRIRGNLICHVHCGAYTLRCILESVLDHGCPIGLDILDNERFVIEVCVEEYSEEIDEEKHAEECKKVHS